jgi:hypothetical protein
MGLEDEYPKTKQRKYKELCALLANDPGLDTTERETTAMMIGAVADKARDLDDIFQRLIGEEHTLEEVGALLIAFQLTMSDLRGSSDVITGKLFDIGDRLKAQPTLSREAAKRRAGNHAKRPVNGKARSRS